MQLFIQSIRGIKRVFQTLNKPILISSKGQSNMNGQNDVSILQSDYPQYYGLIEGVKWFGSDNAFIPYEVGSYTSGTQTQAGPHPSLAYELFQYYGQPVHFVNSAVSGTQLYKEDGVTDWNAESVGEHLDNSINKNQLAIAEMDALYGSGNWIYAADLWNQGEYDSLSPKVDVYEENEWALVQKVWSVFGEIPFISSGVKGKTAVNNAKINNALKSSKYRYFSNEDLTFTSDVHYDIHGQVQHGLKFFNELKNIYRK